MKNESFKLKTTKMYIGYDFVQLSLEFDSLVVYTMGKVELLYVSSFISDISL